MSARIGFERISAVLWGVCGALTAWFMGYVIYAEDADARLVMTCLGVLLGLYVAHRLTCWVIQGFFK